MSADEEEAGRGEAAAPGGAKAEADGSAGALAAELRAGPGDDNASRKIALAIEIERLQGVREQLKKEKKAAVAELRNKKKKYTRLKRKAAALSDKDLFDIVRLREMDRANKTAAAGARGSAEPAPGAAAEDGAAHGAD